MSDPTTILSEPPPEKPPFSLWRRLLWITGISFLLLVIIGGALFTFEQSRADRRTKGFVAELDENDPGWRLEEIEAARLPIPDARNSALLCKELARLLGGSWPDPKFDEQFQKLPLPELLDARRMKLLQAEMKRLEPLRLAARPLAEMPRGRYEINYSFNPIATLLPDAQGTRQVATLCRYEMLYQSNKGDVTEAVRSGRACVCAGRALFDEPFLISQLVRIACITIGLKGVEGSLSLGEAKEEELILLQKLLAEEEKHPTLLMGMRGERAVMYQLFSRMGSGAITADSIRHDLQMTDGSWLEKMTVFQRLQFQRQLPILMETMNRAVENARLPPWEQAGAEAEFDQELKKLRTPAPLVGMFVPAIQKVAQACRRKTAVVACLRTLLAVERFRMKHGKMPERLAAVVPDFLDRVPLDPYDGKPLRMARLEDSVIVYSVGPDGSDDGGKLDREQPTKAGTDLGFQLWDLVKRRQPASAPGKPPTRNREKRKTMSDPTTLPAETGAQNRPFSLWRRIGWIAGISFVLLVIIGGSLFTLEQLRSDRRTKNSVEELDENDPGWRLEEIEAARLPIPDARNSALLCKELARQLALHWRKYPFYEPFEKTTLPEVLDAKRMKLLEAEMKRLGPIRVAARRLADMPKGRYDINYSFNPVATLLPDVQGARDVARLLRYDMLYQSNKGDVTEAVRSGRACVCAGRSLYDEPFLVSQLARIVIIIIALHGVEGSLSLGEAREEELIALQKLLAEEEKHPTLLMGMRGERAAMYQFFSRVGSGDLPPNSILTGKGAGQGTWIDQVTMYPAWQYRRQHPIMMETMNRAVENAHLPMWEQTAHEKKFDQEMREVRKSAWLVTMLLPAVSKIAEACRRKTAQVACLRTLLAVERFRMKHGKMPKNLAAVMPDFLDRVPLDPYDGKPLRMARLEDSVIVYSVGPDGSDDGGKLDREQPTKAGTDLGFQLWDLVKRRQPASPAKAEEKNP